MKAGKCRSTSLSSNDEGSGTANFRISLPFSLISSFAIVSLNSDCDAFGSAYFLYSMNAFNIAMFKQ